MYDLEKEKREAVKAGERALASLKSAKSKLDEAKSWGLSGGKMVRTLEDGRCERLHGAGEERSREVRQGAS